MSSFGMSDDAVVRGVELRLDTAIDGLQTAAQAAGITQVTIGKQVLTIADAIKLAVSKVEPWKKGRQAKAILRQLGQDRDRDNEAALEFLAELKASLIVSLGRESEALTSFGFKPYRKPKGLSPEEKVLRAAKAKATRAARHTLGVRQKAEIKGEPVAEVTVKSAGGSGAPANPAKPESGGATRTAV